MRENLLRKHIFSTYLTLRYGMATVAIAFPVLLYAVGLWHGIELQDSMSHYYFALSPDDTTKMVFPMRVWFVGILFAIGTFLYLYKGFTPKENIALNFAGTFAVGVAVFPMGSGHGGLSVHGICAVLLFICLAFVSIACAHETLRYLGPGHEKQQVRFRRLYAVIGLIMITSPAVAFLLALLLMQPGRYVFFAEAVGVWAFGAYWWTKSQEMALSQAEERALKAEIEPPPSGSKPPPVPVSAH